MLYAKIPDKATVPRPIINPKDPSASELPSRLANINPGQKPSHPQAAPARIGNPFVGPYAITAFTSSINITIPVSKVIPVSLTPVRVGI